MALTAALAFLLAAFRPRRFMEVQIAASALAVIVAFAVLNFLIEQLLGVQCPGCSRLTLKRLARYRRYYRCACCGLRVKRYGFGPWLDATGPEDAPRYRRRDADRPWAGFSVPETLEGTTSGSLLRNKRSRARARGRGGRDHPGPA
jgi:hypothetical protein